MKATDLMIGDLITFKDCQNEKNPVVLKIWQINEEDEVLASIDGDESLDEITINEDIAGIPITPEILEKNGFGVQDQGGGRKDVWIGFGVDCEGDIEIEFQHGIPTHLKVDGVFKGEYYTSTNIKYVHELQHALRLCRTEKTIEL